MKTLKAVRVDGDQEEFAKLTDENINEWAKITRTIVVVITNAVSSQTVKALYDRSSNLYNYYHVGDWIKLTDSVISDKKIICGSYTDKHFKKLFVITKE